jgi:hypothetical protein
MRYVLNECQWVKLMNKRDVTSRSALASVWPKPAKAGSFSTPGPGQQLFPEIVKSWISLFQAYAIFPGPASGLKMIV